MRRGTMIIQRVQNSFLYQFHWIFNFCIRNECEDKSMLAISCTILFWYRIFHLGRLKINRKCSGGEDSYSSTLMYLTNPRRNENLAIMYRIKSRSDERFDNLNIEYQNNNIMKELKQPWFFQNHSLNIIAD